FFGDAKLAAQHSRWQPAVVRPADRLIPAVPADPAGRPVLRIQHAHAPPRGHAPYRDVAVLIPDPHFPPAGGMRLQLLASVSDMQRLVRRDLAGVPEGPFGLAE